MYLSSCEAKPWRTPPKLATISVDLRARASPTNSRAPTHRTIASFYPAFFLVTCNRARLKHGVGRSRPGTIEIGTPVVQIVLHMRNQCVKHVFRDIRQQLITPNTCSRCQEMPRDVEPR
eukprot:9102495-Pyramimonas_sp.AAC.2